jgi:2-keto-4-pentenoate hydratase/2-oxohepta-3-ene-1,7-dioic acid hydratase in catechol pathway
MKVARYQDSNGLERTGRVDGSILSELDHTGAPTGRVDARDTVSLLPAISSRASFICVGLNYREHAREAGVPIPQEPLLFAKLGSSLLAAGAPIVVPPVVTQVDWEGELGVVIGRTCARVTPQDASAYIWGYVPVNDVSARDLQFADGQWLRGKSVDTFGPVGPYLLTKDEVPDPQSLAITTSVNGEIVQQSTTADMIFTVAEIISHVSRTITLQRGDLIATGTPSGVGAGMSPPRYLSDGDVVRVEISGMDALENRVVKEFGHGMELPK